MSRNARTGSRASCSGTRRPQLASGDQIFAVPTLVRQLPRPLRKIIGDLSDTESVLVGLDIQPAR